MEHTLILQHFKLQTSPYQPQNEKERSTIKYILAYESIANYHEMEKQIL